MATDPLSLSTFTKLFSGATKNYGECIYPKTTAEGAKVEGRSKTVRDKLLTTTQYRDHLEGKKGLGIIPIMDDGVKCRFGVIDVDIYDQDLSPYLDAIDRMQFPLVPFYSKSGGLHLYLFLKTAQAAKGIVEMLQQMAIMLSLDQLVKRITNRGIEVFPKQTRVAAGNVGNWINLPYYNAEKATAVAIRNGKRLSLSEALKLIESRRFDAKTVRAFIEDAPYADGPPCLQTVTMLDPLEKSGRNVFLFTVGTYLKKKDETTFEQKLFEVNQSLKHPLEDRELEETIISSLRKKDYSYKCTESPCVDYCNKALCKTKQYGVGRADGHFSDLEFGQMRQVNAHEPYYTWEVRQQGQEKFATLQFATEDEIIRQDVFLRLCFRELHILPVRLKATAWAAIVNQSLAELEVEEIKPEDDISSHHLLLVLLEQFFVTRPHAQQKTQVNSGRAYVDVKADAYLFRKNALLQFLYYEKNFKGMSPNVLNSTLKTLGMYSKVTKDETNKSLRVHCLPMNALEVGTNGTGTGFVADFRREEGDF